MKALLAILTAIVVLTGCGDPVDEPLTVFAASSLADVLPQLDPDARGSFAGSDELAVQIREGAPADVFLSASSRYAEELVAEGLAAEPKTFARNRLVLVVPSDDPAGIHGLADLRRADVRLVLAGAGVPLGDYARDLLNALDALDLLDQVVSEELDARGVLAKVALGEADAGIVYSTDAKATADVRVLPLPAAAQPQIEYVVVLVAESDQPEAARAFVERLLGPEGRAALRAAGFTLP